MKQGPMLFPGDVVFFKTCSREMDKNKVLGFKGGWGFGVMLGIVPPNGRMPIEADLMMLMGSAGFIAFDDVMAFFGDEKWAECKKWYEDKYYPKPKKIDVVQANGQPGGPRLILPGKH